MTIHVEPLNALIEHLAHDCPCGPAHQWADPDTGTTYPAGPLVLHHSLDGRETHE